jgi:hypothetical protein
MGVVWNSLRTVVPMRLLFGSRLNRQVAWKGRCYQFERIVLSVNSTSFSNIRVYTVASFRVAIGRFWFEDLIYWTL